MNEDKKRILDMLAEGTITAEDAALLLDQLTDGRDVAPVYHPGEVRTESGDKMLRVVVDALEPGKDKPVNVNINLPLKAARIAGRMITAMMPNAAREAMAQEGIDLSQMDFDELIDALEETGGDIVNVTHEDGEERVLVRIYVQ